MATKFAPQAEVLDAVEAPTFLNHHAGIDDTLSAGAASMKRCMEQTLKHAEGINARRVMADRRITFAANLEQVEREVGKFSTEATERFRHARAALASSTAEAEARLTKAVGVAPTGNAAEIRSALRAMSAEDRAEAMREAFASGDKEVLGAIVGVTKVMHGCDPETVNALFDKFKRDTAPMEFAAVTEHRRYTEWADKSELFVLQFGTRALKGTEAYAAKRKSNAAVLKTYGMDIED